MMGVKLASVYQRYKGEPFEKLFKRFRKLVEQEHILSEFMRKRFYMKPSEYKRYKSMKAELRRKKQRSKQHGRKRHN